MKKSFLILLTLMALNHTTQAQEDKYLWLEEVDGQKALQYVNEQNKATFDKLSLEKEYQSIYDKNLEIYNSNEQIAFPSILGKYVYNFWKDKEHVRGIWRRCLLTDYLNKSMIWETLLDIDALSEKDNKKWVYKGASGLYPDYNRFLISLSNGGGDAVVVKEFDVTKKEFVDLGFTLAESKGNISYVDENTVIVATNFGEGTMTTSGYPLLIKLWKRGTPIGQAQAIYEGVKSDVSCSGYVMRDGDVSYTFLERNISFFSGEKLVWKDNIPFYLDLPEDSKMKGILKNQLILQLKSDWLVAGESYKNGSLLSVNFTELLNGTLDVKTILVPDSYSSISEVSLTKNKLLVNILSNVTSELYIYSYSDSWSSKIVKAPELGTISIVSTDEASDYYFFTFENFITPSTLYKADAYNNSFSKYQSLPAYFDATNYIVEQFNAQSKDGTLVPYFIVRPKQMKYNGSNPTLIYAYGGFEISMQPFYMSTYGASWLENGGVFVLANIRGGGEYGPQWHQAGMKEKRQNVFDDFYAVSEDLLTRKITSPKNLGIMGGSNGGLLVGVAFTQRPDLFNAAVCQVPLLDMQRYNKLLAGASWMGEYGNPDVPAEWDYIKKYSPYQNLNKKMKYPEVFFYTSTRDDRVHPGHARKMNAKMQDMGYTTYYYENTEGGHAGSSTNEQRAKSNALTFSYLLMKLKSI